MDTNRGERRRVSGGVMNWAIGIGMYTMCIKWMTNKKLLYKKINYIKFKKGIHIGKEVTPYLFEYEMI